MLVKLNFTIVFQYSWWLVHLRGEWQIFGAHKYLWGEHSLHSGLCAFRVWSHQCVEGRAWYVCYFKCIFSMVSESL